MSYIAHLKSLSDDERTEEIKSKILEAQKSILDDSSRTRLLDDDDLNCWDDIDELSLEPVRFDEEANECVVMFRWQSSGPRDEDDERELYGDATATFADDESVSFSDLTAAFEGDAPTPAPENPDDEDEQQRRQDEEDKGENMTKDW
jgi:hypothetical protein